MMTSDISVLLAHLEIKEPVHICAHSMGTLVAQDFALKFPRQVKTLILLAPFAYYPAESLSLPLLRKIYNMDLENKAKTFLNLLFSQNFAQEILHTPEFYQFYKATLEEKENSSLQDLEYQARIMNSDLRDKIKDISCAVLLLAGNEDKLVPLESMSLLKEEIKNSRLNIIPGAGHALQIDSALRINPLIYQFLQENQAE
jgi:pimeloyl-ACP methyl ester carboxylesterase